MSIDGKATIHYLEGTTLVGSREVYCCGTSIGRGERHSAFYPNTAYFCPHCGEIWGRAVYDFQFQYSPIPTAFWVTESRRCPAHGDGYLLVGLTDAELLLCSTPLLAREALLLSLNHKE